MRILFSTIVAVVAVGFGEQSAQAQAPGRPAGPVRTPGFSPYLNLLRQGNSAGVNYYGLVRPQVDARNEFRALQGQITDNRRAITDQAVNSSALPSTGDKTVTFLNTGGYFMNLSPQGGGGGAGFGTMGAGGSGQSGGSQGGGGSRGRSAPARR